MTKILYNACFGGFGLSQAALAEYTRLTGKYAKNAYGNIDRSDPDLVAVVESMGEAANGLCANLRIRELPVGTRYRIDEYDGLERVMTIDEHDWKTA